MDLKLIARDKTSDTVRRYTDFAEATKYDHGLELLKYAGKQADHPEMTLQL